MYNIEYKQLTLKLTKYLLHLGVKNDSDVEDLVQEVFVRLLTKMSKLEIISVEAYCIGLAKNIFREYIKEKMKHLQVFDHVPVHLIDEKKIKINFIDPFVHILLEQEINLLPERMKTILIQRIINEVPSAVLAEKLGTTVSAIDLCLFRTKKRLRKKLVMNRKEKKGYLVA
jgi:RNA polymerase sigma-70 factor (ECF subfamily)